MAKGGKDGGGKDDKGDHGADTPDEISNISNFSGAEEVKDDPAEPLMRPLPPATTYPLEAFGPLMRGAIAGIHDMSQAAVAVCAQSVLAVGALAVQTHYDVVLPITQQPGQQMGLQQPTSLFFVTVAESGDRKSTVDKLAMGAIKQREREMREANQTDLFNYTNKKAAYEKAKETILNEKKLSIEKTEQLLNELGPGPPAPLTPLLTVPEPTFEGMTKLLAIGHPSVGIFSAEGGQFISGHAMSDKERIKTAAGLSVFWDGSDITRVRATDAVLCLRGRRVSFHLMAQPGVAAELLGDPILADQGLLSRILIAAPASPAGTRLWREALPSSAVEIGNFDARILWLLRREMPLAADTTNELEPTALNLSATAKNLWTSFHNEIEIQTGQEGPLHPIKGLACKLHEHAARIAAVIAVVEGRVTDAREIDDISMASGITIARYHMAEALRLYDVQRTDPHILRVQTVWDWIRTSWGHPLISAPDIYQNGPNFARDKTVAKSIIATLEDHHSLVFVGPNEVNGKKRRQTYRINNVG